MTVAKRPDRELPRGTLTNEGRAILLEFAQEIAAYEGGVLISAQVQGYQSKLEWECANGHRWEKSLKSVRKSTRWCPECRKLGIAPDQLNELEKLKRHAASQGGKCLSDCYLGTKSPLDWICNEGHRFTDHANKIWNRSKRNAFCPECGKKRRGCRTVIKLERLQEYAKSKGGKCLALKYKNAHTEVEWECAKKHRFRKNANRVLHQKDWCSACAGNVSLDIAWFHDYAVAKGGHALRIH